jgi:hypothetical protein
MAVRVRNLRLECKPVGGADAVSARAGVVSPKLAGR